jgi:predicted DNA-binding transcriptional regulator AlpA
VAPRATPANTRCAPITLLKTGALINDVGMVQGDRDELMSSGEIAEELGWQNSGTAATLWRRGTFPAPVIDKPRARLWRRSDVEEWVRTAHRRPWRRREPSA